MKPSIIVIMGYTGAGKDTFYNLLSSMLTNKVAKLSFVGPCKRKLEAAYNLPQGSLDTPEYKKQTMPDLGITYLDFLTQSYQVFQRVAPEYWVDIGHQRADKMLAQGQSPVFTDIRNPRELDVVFDLVTGGYPLHLIYISRQGAQPLISDCFCDRFVDLLTPIASTVTQVDNSGSRDDLELAVEAFVDNSLLEVAL